MMFDDEEELLSDNKVTDQVTYDFISKAHEGLNKADQELTIIQLGHAYSQYEKEVLAVAAVRQYLYETYNEKIKARKSIAWLSRDFKMSVKGHNNEVSQQLGEAIWKAHREEAASYRAQAVKTLIEAGLNFGFLTSPEVVSILQANPNNVHARTAMPLLQQIVQYKEILFRSVILLAVKTGKSCLWRGVHAGRGGYTKKWTRLAGDVIEESDLIQQSVIEAKAAIDLFKPELHNALTSYVRTYVRGNMSKFVNENTRIVPIPRKVLDRFAPVQKVIDANPALIQYGRYDYTSIAREASELKEGAPFTVAEVEDLLLNVSKETASLDLEVADDYDGSTPITLGESLINPIRSQEILTDKFSFKEKLLKVIREHTSIQEFTVLKLRWGGSRVLSLDQTAKAYTQLTELDMNKGKVALIEREVFKRLKASKDSRFDELLDVLSDFSEEKQTTLIDIQDGVIRCGGRRMTT